MRERWRRRRRASQGGRSDLLGQIRSRADEPLPFEPASEAAIAEAEESLDFSLPPLLKRVLRQVGNGGFGPGHGLLGVSGGATDEHGNSLVDLYDGLSAKNPDDLGWSWPQYLVPIAPWGDSTYSCADCTSREGRIVTFDASSYQPGEDLARLLEAQDLTLEAWLRAWAEGVDLWARMFPLE